MGNYRKEVVVREYQGKEVKVPIVYGTANLTGDIKVREVKISDGSTATVAGGFGQSVAFNYKSKGEEKTDYYELEAWGKTAELLAELGKRGSHLFITGRHKVLNYPDKNGVDRQKDILVVEDFQMTPRIKETGSVSHLSRNNTSPTLSKVGDADMIPIDDEDIPF